MVNGNADGVYFWRVDCVEEGTTGTIKEGNTWKFNVTATP